MQHRTARSLLPLLGIVVAACGQQSQSIAPPALSTSTSSSSVPEQQASVASAAPPAPATPDPAYVAATRLERWDEAAKLIDALDPAEKAKPEVRFLRARVANALGDQASVRPLLDGLDLPLLAPDFARLKAEAAVEVGPYAEGAAYYKEKGRPRDLVLAAKALQKGGDVPGALSLADRALAEAVRLGRAVDERAAHAARVDILRDKIDQAMPDVRWLAIHAPASPEGEDARKILADKKQTLSEKELETAIEALNEAGAGREALDMLDRYGKDLPHATEAQLRAQALLKSRQYEKAASAYAALARGPSSGNGEELYYAGKALARTKHEGDAIQRWEEVVHRYRTGPWADRAAFQIGQTEMTRGHYADAEKAFVAYLAAFPGGASKNDADYDLALAYLSTKKPESARKIFERLAENAKRTDVGTLRELAGVAALRAGAKDDAVQLFSRVASEQPLTWGAMAARARLASLGATLPPVMDVPVSTTAATPLLVALPSRAERLRALGLDGDAEAALSENEQTAGSMYPGRESEALCAMYGKLSRAKRRYKVGTAAVSFDALMHAPSDADRWMWDCTYPAPYADAVASYEHDYEIPTGLIHAVMRQESGFDPDAASPVGAMGLMQLMPATATEAAKEANVPFSPTEIKAPDANVRIGGFYLAKLAKNYGGSLPLVAASYNAGPGSVTRWVETSGEPDIDVWVARIPYDETRTYVARVMSNLARYEWLRGGSGAVMEIPLSLPTGVHANEDDY